MPRWRILKQRQVLNKVGCRSLPTFPFQFLQNFLGAIDNGGGKPRQSCHVNAIGPVGYTRNHFMQEDDVVLPLLHFHGGVCEVRQLRRQLGQFMIMRCKERPASC